MNFQNMLQLAKTHQEKGDMVSSAKLCITEGERAYKAGAFESAKHWVLKSLAYSVGICHPDYIKANEQSKG